MATNEGYYAKVVKESSGKYTMATEEIERDLHRYIHCAEFFKQLWNRTSLHITIITILVQM